MQRHADAINLSIQDNEIVDQRRYMRLFTYHLFPHLGHVFEELLRPLALSADVLNDTELGLKEVEGLGQWIEARRVFVQVEFGEDSAAKGQSETQKVQVRRDSMERSITPLLH